jgi:hypothetical protein
MNIGIGMRDSRRTVRGMRRVGSTVVRRVGWSRVIPIRRCLLEALV